MTQLVCSPWFKDFWRIFRGGEGGLKIWENWKYWIWGLLKMYDNVPDGPPPQQGASHPNSRLTCLRVYFFYSTLSPSQVNIISPKEQPDCPLKLRLHILNKTQRSEGAAHACSY